ncbi:Uma2 family endonuclease [Leptolyngbya subtilissima]|uniref:Uma2 family endonuclease n=1 Tax=Leptolyngbya subtilissima TaxID=1346803 RepID=UPI003D66212A
MSHLPGLSYLGAASDRPDLAWIEQSRWDAFTPEQRQKFSPIAPSFVLKLLSPSDRLSVVQTKMQEYMVSGVRLGWLINPSSRQVEVYRQEQVPELLNNPAHLLGETVLPGFVLNMNLLIW